MQTRSAKIAVQYQDILIRLRKRHSQVGGGGALAVAEAHTREHYYLGRGIDQGVEEVGASHPVSVGSGAVGVVDGHQIQGSILTLSVLLRRNSDGPALWIGHANVLLVLLLFVSLNSGMVAKVGTPDTCSTSSGERQLWSKYSINRARPMPSITPNTAARTPFLKGSGLTGLSGTIAFSYTLAVNWLPAALLSEMSSEDTWPTVLTIFVASTGSLPS